MKKLLRAVTDYLFDTDIRAACNPQRRFYQECCPPDEVEGLIRDTDHLGKKDMLYTRIFPTVLDSIIIGLSVATNEPLYLLGIAPVEAYRVNKIRDQAVMIKALTKTRLSCLKMYDEMENRKKEGEEWKGGF